MEVSELVGNLDEAIANADAELAMTVARVDHIRQRIGRLRAQRAAVVSALAELGQEENAPTEVTVARHALADEWRKLPRTLAVERALAETGIPMSLKEIGTYLSTRGREGDTLSYISAAISHLRGSGVPIESVARGVWVLDRPRIPSDSPPELENLLSGGHSPGLTLSEVFKGVGERLTG